MFSQELLKRFPVKVVERSVIMLSHAKPYVEINEVRIISPFNVMAEAWSPDRLRDVTFAFDRGEKLDPIYVDGYILPDGSRLYSLSDGNHRTIVTRKRGKKRIAATVSCISECLPALHFFSGGYLCRNIKGSVRRIQPIQKKPVDEAKVSEFWAKVQSGEIKAPGDGVIIGISVDPDEVGITPEEKKCMLFLGVKEA